MITLIPATLKSFPLGLDGEIPQLEAAVSQIGRLDLNQSASFYVDPHFVLRPDVLAVIERAIEEGYSFRVVVGGGQTPELRKASSALLFIPTSRIEKISVDDLATEVADSQRQRSSKQAAVAPSLASLRAIVNDRPGAKPAIKALVPQAPQEEGGGDGDIDENDGL